MEDLTIELLIRAQYSGAASDVSSYVNLAIQTVAVLIGGIVLWRISVVIHKKKVAQRSRNQFFETSYSKGWKRK
ncbi:MAG: hypothetical protein COA33_011490 [Fluviicola sp.]|nr:hypothetical protein [Fluviicola sp.]